uniref:Uncharacterized protein n=1 Tax=Melopsittacus undulatus TaxID=13146 RepID=A0A8C6K4V4_MELUD
MADKLVESKIRCDKVTLFKERGCCYCRNAEEMLKQYNFVPGALEVVDITQRKDVQDCLQRRTGHRTVSSRSCSSPDCCRRCSSRTPCRVLALGVKPLSCLCLILLVQF